MKLTTLLIVINITVFLYTFLNDPEYWINNYGFNTDNFLAGRYETIITSMFLHGSLWHLLWNMLYLFLLGSSLEKKSGALKYILVYFLGGIAGNLSMFIPVFSEPGSIGVGASAAISSLVGLGTFICPGRLVIFPTFPVPFIVAGAMYFLFTLIHIFDVSGIAYPAHLFGLIIGCIFGLMWSKNRKKRILIFIIVLLLILVFPYLIAYLE